MSGEVESVKMAVVEALRKEEKGHRRENAIRILQAED